MTTTQRLKRELGLTTAGLAFLLNESESRVRGWLAHDGREPGVVRLMIEESAAWNPHFWAGRADLARRDYPDGRRKKETA